MVEYTQGERFLVDKQLNESGNNSNYTVTYPSPIENILKNRAFEQSAVTGLPVAVEEKHMSAMVMAGDPINVGAGNVLGDLFPELIGYFEQKIKYHFDNNNVDFGYSFIQKIDDLVESGKSVYYENALKWAEEAED